MGNLEMALYLREKKEFEKSNGLLMDLAKQNPGDAVIQYQCAWSFDILGLEVKAVPYYEAELELGLPEEDAKGAYLGLGSTYRTIGEYEKSRRTLESGLEKFPGDKPLLVFRAMAFYNLAQHDLAMESLLKIIAETSRDREIQSYAKAIEFYSDKLDKVFT
ncbi:MULTISPECIES: tetratricopeptide repeat protein [unclassified Bacillus (in: firmicutes)]|uniref:tetratricopeptide repeat protein n=1 Tax=unclassified Bacillus (in: firmicutes) TaxID=185979 RepID=UPI001BE5B112|nr:MULTISPECIES: tetratricopeptide repeat protein [unclassified Bacillus (in: firmicutes)]MBT2615241.1 tetratricopeptide repeat protein [Bacillus sp. ISL-78]MBT2628146.1 tetratricopeptide repeat protein [Bacillus sp. ISL-101]MBT2717669.1 tetratricopeptide repeat protein [Bacillus sp. ISL-57]